MNEVAAFLRANPLQYFSTVGLDGKPKVRPFQFMIEEGGRFYFCTSNKKKVFKEMQKQPYVEICVAAPDFAWLRLAGKVVFTQDLAIKEKIQATSPLVRSLYKTADNPVFEAFYLDDATATIADFSGNPPKTWKL